MTDEQGRLPFWERRGKWVPAAALLLLVGIYTLLYARLLFSREYTSGGDTHLYWSFRYMLFYSLKYFHTLPWWSPETFNGYPLYFYIISGWTNYLGPYCLPSLALFKVLALVGDVNINDYLVFQQTVYPFTLNLIAIYLISRELTKSTVASLLPPFLFTFSYYQLMNFHDFYAYEAMIAPLFFLYGLIRYNNARSRKNLIIFLVLTAMLFASLQNGIVMSAVFWGGLFTVLVLAFNPGIFRDTGTVLRELTATGKGRVVLAFLLVTLVVAFAAAWLPFSINAGHLLKYRNTVMELPDGRLHGVSMPTEYDTSGAITNQPVPITNSEIWSILQNWLPFPEVHDYLLRFTWDSHEFRYIGIATIPLIITALILARRNSYVYISVLTFFIINAFFIYADKNLFYKVLFDLSDIVRNTTNVSTILPRGGASLFLIFLAGIGLDALLVKGTAEGGPDVREPAIARLYRNTTTALLIVAFLMLVFGVLAWSLPGYEWMRHTLFHLGFYLLVFSFVCKVLWMGGSRRATVSLLVILFLFAFMDLTVSSSAHLLNRNNFAPEDTSKHILIPYDKLAAKGKTIPDKLAFKPIRNEQEQMFPLSYMGVYHNPWQIMWGTREWLYFGSREEGAKLLTNWNGKTFHMTEAPSFQLYSNAYYIPFEAIKGLDANKQWYDSKPLFFLHDRRLISPEPPRPLGGAYDIKEYTYNSVDVLFQTSEKGFLYFLDNYDRFWNAYLDGKRVPIHRANFTFKAIELPAGEHRVRWVYDPWPVKLLYALFYGMLFVGAAWYGWEWYRKTGGRGNVPR